MAHCEINAARELSLLGLKPFIKSSDVANKAIAIAIATKLTKDPSAPVRNEAKLLLAITKSV